ncbi:hypothetical protein [Neorhizobium alkalisoli]|uniref:hypothetical protein n=1 Tax=Neorhizobium alkalisoli TaxID=528178 RepID=UPI00131A0C1B|nr:hypothetical protein [Neorhizobium alkalisoli]
MAKIAEHIRALGVFAVMETGTHNELSQLVLRYAGDPTVVRQLKRLPAFGVPHDSEKMFQNLLDRLDRATAGAGQSSGLKESL